jgi:hypothetical protein
MANLSKIMDRRGRGKEEEGKEGRGMEKNGKCPREEAEEWDGRWRDRKWTRREDNEGDRKADGWMGGCSWSVVPVNEQNWIWPDGRAMATATAMQCCCCAGLLAALHSWRRGKALL